MIEAWGLEEYELSTLLLAAGALLGVAFGVAAQISRFCLRRALAGEATQRSSAGGVWSLALLVAVLGAQTAIYAGYVDVSDTRFVAGSLPVAALVFGGLIFGAGMILTRGCPSRLTVLAAGGNLRATIVLLVFAILAYATLRGAFAPFAVWLHDAGGIDGAGGSIAGNLGADWGGLAVGGVVAAALALIVLRSGAKPRDLALGAVVGLTILGGWLATGFVLQDEFDPQPVDSLAFTAGAADSLYYFMLATALKPTFGLGLILGALSGAHLSARLRGEVKLESFENPAQTSRYLAGAAMMGVGGVLAGGCTIGAGLTGVSTLGLAPIIALGSIIAGAKLAFWLQSERESRAAFAPAE